MRRSIPCLLALSFFLGAPAFADNERRHKPAEYQDVTDEDRAAAKEKSRSRVTTWRESEPQEEYKFPWMQIIFFSLTLAVAVPFAWSFYNRQAKALKEAAAGMTPAPRKRSKASASQEE